MSKPKPSSPQPAEPFDIVVIGGGIVGQSLALSLLADNKAANLAPASIALVDSAAVDHEAQAQAREVDVNAFDSRVSALTAASREAFMGLGIWEDLEASGICPYRQMTVWDAEGTGNIHFKAGDIQQENLGHIAQNRHIAAALYKQLSDFENITIIQGDRVEDIGGYEDKPESGRNNILLASGRVLSCPLLLGADGANSVVRAQAGFKVKAWDYRHQAIVATVKTERPHLYTASQCFTSSGPLAFLPLLNPSDESPGAQYYSSIVWSCTPEQASELMLMDDSGFCTALGKAFEFKRGKIQQVSRRHVFPLWQRHARDYVKPGIALVGDAAHTIHPLAGQGVNLGIQDARVLAQVIRAAMARGEDYASGQVLSRYQRQRKGQNLGMMLLMESFKRVFASDNLTLRWLRNTGLSGVDKAGPVKQLLMRKAMGL